MTMLDIHQNALRSPNVTYHGFLNKYRANANTVYGIVEGKEDPMFYRGQIESILPDGWNIDLIPAGNKDNVINAISAFDWNRFSKKMVCFFVDRDLSDFIPEMPTTIADNLYVTDNYSIENDIVNFDTFKRLLSEALSINEITPEEEIILREKFNSAINLFQDAMSPIMAQIILWKTNGKKPCLNDIIPKDFFKFEHGKFCLRQNYHTPNSRIQRAAQCVNLPPAQPHELTPISNKFLSADGHKKFTRGKYMMWLFVELANGVHQSIDLISPRFKKPPTVKVNIGIKNAMVIIAPRVRCPASLRQFLENTYNQFIREQQTSSQ